MKTIIGVIGGSGLYAMNGLTKVREVKVSTPFGRPSDACITGTLNGVTMVFLPRHGRGHRISPTEINYRANIFAMKKLGVQWIISASAVGSMKEGIAPGHIVIPDQFFDRTVHRHRSFFGNGVVVHTAMADPVCPDLARALADAAQASGAVVHRGGTYLCIEGPQFSTRAESRIYRQWGVDVIGMTNMPEARLAREAEICYSTMALVTDYDVWHEGSADVTVEAVIATLNRNVARARDIIRRVVGDVSVERRCLCAAALKDAIITEKKNIPAKVKKDLNPLIGRYL